MDALSKHLDSLARLGSLDSEGAFTLAEGQVWERLRQALPDGDGSLRFLLRWLHARGASEIAIVAEKASSLTVTGQFSAPDLLPALLRGESLDISGKDIDLARATVGAQMLDVRLLLSIDDGQARLSRDFQHDESWASGPSCGQAVITASYQMIARLWPRVESWERDIRKRFRCSQLPLLWNGVSMSGPYSFESPMLAWRHLRPTLAEGTPLVVTAPRTARASFRAARGQAVDVVLGMLMGNPSGDVPEFTLLRHGELLPLAEAEHEISGFGGMIRSDTAPVDLQGDKPVWTAELQALVATFKDEAVDMALQLFHQDPPIEPREAEAVFLGMQSVLLHLLDHQRFTEGHFLSEWLRSRLLDSVVLKGFRAGYTFDRISSLLAEPAGHPQTAMRWRKSAEARVRAASSRQPEVVDEALLVTARLELRSRRNQTTQLSGDTEGKLSQLAFREERKGRYREAADIYMMLAMAQPLGKEQRLEFLTNAARCGQQAGLPYYAGALAREKTAYSGLSRE